MHYNQGRIQVLGFGRDFGEVSCPMWITGEGGGDKYQSLDAPAFESF